MSKGFLRAHAPAHADAEPAIIAVSHRLRQPSAPCPLAGGQMGPTPSEALHCIAQHGGCAAVPHHHHHHHPTRRTGAAAAGLGNPASGTWEVALAPWHRAEQRTPFMLACTSSAGSLVSGRGPAHAPPGAGAASVVHPPHTHHTHTHKHAPLHHTHYLQVQRHACHQAEAKPGNPPPPLSCREANPGGANAAQQGQGDSRRSPQSTTTDPGSRSYPPARPPVVAIAAVRSPPWLAAPSPPCCRWVCPAPC